MLESLYQQEKGMGKSEILVIDDGSDEDLVCKFKIMQEKFRFRYYRSENKGRAHARNLGVEHARYDLLVFIDDDVLLTPDFLVQHVDSQKVEPKVLHGEIKNFVYSYPFSNPVNGILFEQEKRLNEKAEYLKYLQMKCNALKDYNDFDKIYKQSKLMKLENKIIEVYDNSMEDLEWISFTGGNVSCPRKWIEEQNGFDEHFGTTWGCEDLELGYRLKKENRRFGYNRSASCCHMDHIKSEAREQHKSSSDYFYEKHNDPKIIELNDYLFNFV